MSYPPGFRGLGGRDPGAQQASADLQIPGRLGHVYSLLGESHGPNLERPIN